jgi:hypothetical protein
LYPGRALAAARSCLARLLFSEYPRLRLGAQAPRCPADADVDNACAGEAADAGAGACTSAAAEASMLDSEAVTTEAGAGDNGGTAVLQWWRAQQTAAAGLVWVAVLLKVAERCAHKKG